MATDLHEMRGSVPERRMQVDGWKTGSFQYERCAFWEVASRNSGSAQRRRLWGLAEANAVGGGPICTEDGRVVDEPSEDELVPHASEEGLAAHSSFPVLGADWNTDLDGKHAEFFGAHLILRR